MSTGPSRAATWLAMELIGVYAEHGLLATGYLGLFLAA